MDDKEAAAELIRLSGVSFRESHVDCPSCRWSGLAGELRMAARISAPDGSVRYACPSCQSIIALHVGLTDGEVLQEMERIRRDLAAELAAQPRARGTGVRAKRARIDFQTVRRQIAVAGSDADQFNQSAGSAEEPAARNASADAAAGNSPHAGASRPEAPDFEAVRRRMGLAETTLDR